MMLRGGGEKLKRWKEVFRNRNPHRKNNLRYKPNAKAYYKVERTLNSIESRVRRAYPSAKNVKLVVAKL